MSRQSASLQHRVQRIVLPSHMHSQGAKAPPRPQQHRREGNWLVVTAASLLHHSPKITSFVLDSCSRSSYGNENCRWPSSGHHGHHHKRGGVKQHSGLFYLNKPRNTPISTRRRHIAPCLEGGCNTQHDHSQSGPLSAHRKTRGGDSPYQQRPQRPQRPQHSSRMVSPWIHG